MDKGANSRICSKKLLFFFKVRSLLDNDTAFQ
uniref:Uncharacterized protein n=1 Tax=Anguilla anguilla TaxID=7936 RepID=A0A0E9UNB7_ANGAN